MPRFGSFCSDNVLRVPNETSLRIVASILRASISRTMLLIARLRAGTDRRAGWARTTLQFTAIKRINRLGSFMMDVTLTHRSVLLNSVGAALPDDDDFAIQSLGNCFNRRLVGSQRPE